MKRGAELWKDTAACGPRGGCKLLVTVTSDQRCNKGDACPLLEWWGCMLIAGRMETHAHHYRVELHAIRKCKLLECAGHVVVQC